MFASFFFFFFSHYVSLQIVKSFIYCLKGLESKTIELFFLGGEGVSLDHRILQITITISSKENTK
jgi:hypothetical protein